MPVVTESSSAGRPQLPEGLFTEDELRRLIWLRATVAAEHHPIHPGEPCGDHQACGRLALALRLRVTGRLVEGVES